MGLFDKLFGKKEKESLDQGLQKTKEGFLSRLTKAVAGKSRAKASEVRANRRIIERSPIARPTEGQAFGKPRNHCACARDVAKSRLSSRGASRKQMRKKKWI